MKFRLEFTENTRVRNSSKESASFADFLLKVEDGKLAIAKELGPCKVRLPHSLMMDSGNLENLCQFHLPNLENNFTEPAWLCSQMIISPTNSAVSDVNNVMIDMFPGQARVYKSRDMVLGNEHRYPLECIDSLTHLGFPPHVLKQKARQCNAHL